MVGNEQPARRRVGRGIDSVWTLVPVLIALAIVLSASESVIIAAAVAAAIIIAIGSLAVRGVLTYRHQLKLEEINAQMQLSRYESQQLEQANLVLERNDTRSGLRDLRDALGQAVPPPPRLRDRVRASDIFGR